MRLEFEPNLTAFPLVENKVYEDDSYASSGDFESLLKKGVSAAQNGDRDQARKLLAQATAVNPACEDAWMWLASISEYPEELLAFLNRVLEINPDNGRALEWRFATNSLLAKTFVQRAIGAHAENSFELAAQSLDQALKHDVDCELAWLWKAKLAQTDDQKLEFLDRTLQLNPENQDAQAAVSEIKQSRSLAAFDEAKAAAAAGNRKKAIEILDDFVKEVPDSVQAWLLKSHLSVGLEGKIEALENALAIDPENAAAKSGLAFLTLTFGAADDVTEPQTYETVEVMEEHESVDLAEQEPAEMLEEVADAAEFESQPVMETVEFEDSAAEVEAVSEELHVEEGFVSAPVFESEAEEFRSQPVMESVEFEEPAVETAAVFDDAPEEEKLDSSPAMEPDPEPEAYQTVPSNEVELASGPENEPADDYKFETEEALVRSVEDMFGLPPVPVDARSETVESLSGYVHEGLNEDPFAGEGPVFAVREAPVVEEPSVFAEPQFEDAAPQFAAASSPFDALADDPFAGFNCPFCASANEPQAFECSTCRATLTLSDIESLLSPNHADLEVVQRAVTSMEAEWNLREFDEQELTNLGLGHLNLNNFESGFKYLQEASRLNPNNVMLAGHVNTLAIRLDEMRRQAENYDATPKGKTILVVDDSPTVRKLIAGKLEKSGHTVICAVDGVDALAKLEDGMPDLVLLDITMPRMDGYEVCKQIRSNPAGRDLPVVMISGKDGFFDKVRGRMAGTTGYVTKPFGPETLMKALETYLLPENIEVS